jgi:hypothetical protein
MSLAGNLVEAYLAGIIATQFMNSFFKNNFLRSDPVGMSGGI